MWTELFKQQKFVIFNTATKHLLPHLNKLPDAVYIRRNENGLKVEHPQLAQEMYPAGILFLF